MFAGIDVGSKIDLLTVVQNSAFCNDVVELLETNVGKLQPAEAKGGNLLHPDSVFVGEFRNDPGYIFRTGKSAAEGLGIFLGNQGVTRGVQVGTDKGAVFTGAARTKEKFGQFIRIRAKRLDDVDDFQRVQSRRM